MAPLAASRPKSPLPVDMPPIGLLEMDASLRESAHLSPRQIESREMGHGHGAQQRGSHPIHPVDLHESNLSALRGEEYRLKQELDRIQSAIAREEAALGRGPHVTASNSIPPPAHFFLPNARPVTEPVPTVPVEPIEVRNAPVPSRVQYIPIPTPARRDDEWIAVLDEARQRDYYWNPVTQETTWTLPNNAILVDR